MPTYIFYQRNSSSYKGIKDENNHFFQNLGDINQEIDNFSKDVKKNLDFLKNFLENQFAPLLDNITTNGPGILTQFKNDGKKKNSF